MTENNDQLLRQFFSNAARQEIADDGFTERVMNEVSAAQPSPLTSRLSLFNRLWTLFCVAAFAVLFVAFRGWELLSVHLEVMLRTLAVESFSVNLLMLAAILSGLLLVAVEEAVSRA